MNTKTACTTLFLAGLALSLGCCRAIDQADVKNLPGLQVIKTIVPSSGEAPSAAADGSWDDNDGEYQATMAPKIQIKQDDVLLKIIEANLDIDTTDEQILLVKKRDDTQGVIRIVVVDFDTVRKTFRMSWEGETQSVAMRNFTLHLEDLVGDHSLQLVCMGLGRDREQTIDVFRKTQGPDGMGLYYESILSLKSDGSIEIGRQERSQAYNQGQKNGVSFPVISYAHDAESENLLDMVKTEHYWSYQNAKYIQGNIEKIPGKKIEEQQLQKLFVSGEKSFEDFLTGIWYRMESREAPTLLIMSPDEKTINFFQKEIQEVYRWTNSYKTKLPHVLYINGKNDLVPFINVFISIEVLSVNSIAMNVSEGEYNTITGNQWEGTYYKLTGISPETFRSRGPETETAAIPSIDGAYETVTGAKYDFTYPFFVITENGKTRHGGYALSMINIPILEMKVLDETGLLSETRVFALGIEKDEALGAVKLTLQPGSLTVSGFVKSSESATVIKSRENDAS